MITLSPMLVSLVGLLTGAACGYAVRRARLCSFGAIEDALIGQDWRRMKVFALALAIALAGTQALILAGLFDSAATTYLPIRVAVLSAAAGALMFGFGMAMVGTCAFGSLVRLGGGDLRSFVTLGVFGGLAYAMLRGVLSPMRLQIFEPVAVEMPGPVPASLVHLAGHLGLSGAGSVLGLAIAAGLLVWSLSDARLRKARRLLTSGIVLGLGVIAGWVATGVLVDDFAGAPRPQSLTFVAPVGRALFGLLIGEGGWGDFGAASVVGVVAGAFGAARQADEFRWEAYDDQREMRRHIGGAVLMGLGGVLAGGCTIGQGLTAGSLLALTWPITVGGIILGARLGIAVLVEGGIRGWLTRE